MRALIQEIDAIPTLTRFGRVARIEGLAIEVTRIDPRTCVKQQLRSLHTPTLLRPATDRPMQGRAPRTITARDIRPGIELLFMTLVGAWLSHRAPERQG